MSDPNGDGIEEMLDKLGSPMPKGFAEELERERARQKRQAALTHPDVLAALAEAKAEQQRSDRQYVEMAGHAAEMEGRAEAAEARAAELERDVRQWQNAHGAAAESFDRIQARLERAERMVDEILDPASRHHPFWFDKLLRLAHDFRSPSPQPTATHFACPQRHLDYEPEAGEPVVHPDTERLDWLELESADVSSDWLDDRRIGFTIEHSGDPVSRRNIREAIDAAREAESDG